MVYFFKNMISNRIADYLPPGLSFKLKVSTIRRRKLMDGIGINYRKDRKLSEARRGEGLKILHAFNKLYEKKLRAQQ